MKNSKININHTQFSYYKSKFQYEDSSIRYAKQKNNELEERIKSLQLAIEYYQNEQAMLQQENEKLADGLDSSKKVIKQYIINNKKQIKLIPKKIDELNKEIEEVKKIIDHNSVFISIHTDLKDKYDKKLIELQK